MTKNLRQENLAELVIAEAQWHWGIHYTGCQIRQTLLISLQRKTPMCNILNYSVDRCWCPRRHFLNHLWHLPRWQLHMLRNSLHQTQSVHGFASIVSKSSPKNSPLEFEVPSGWIENYCNRKDDGERNPIKVVFEVKELEALQTHFFMLMPILMLEEA